MTRASATFTESEVEDAALEWLGSLGWKVAHGPDIAPHAAGSERSDYTDVILEQQLRNALDRLNPTLPAEAVEDAFRRLTRPQDSTLETRNRVFHRMLVDGVTVEHRDLGGTVTWPHVSVLDYEHPANNDWLAVNQFTVVEGQHERRPDVVLFVNGLPLGLIELKNPADEKATVWTAWQQIQTYKAELSKLFAFNAALIASDGVGARMGDAHRRAGVVQAVAHDRRRDAGRPAPASAAGDARRDVRAAPVPGVDSELHRVRGRRQRQAGQEDGRISPVPRGGDCGAGDPARGGAAAGSEVGRGAGRPVRERQAAGRRSRRPSASASSGTLKAPARA